MVGLHGFGLGSASRNFPTLQRDCLLKIGTSYLLLWAYSHLRSVQSVSMSFEFFHPFLSIIFFQFVTYISIQTQMNKRVMEGRKEGTNWVLNQSMMFFYVRLPNWLTLRPKICFARHINFSIQYFNRILLENFHILTQLFFQEEKSQIGRYVV